ncbi:hydroxymethylbilane synthase [Demequina sp. TTPB684]|uniref:hydroxymethylbilane synthase n=1 Tax=unclassified Demequina TaxID=2620311 RepID=UPI001CF3D1FD|nr:MULTISPECIES: hydroxymethylbilane synthase [unclassified Demequina]MCB2411525.1 hydroxymethylbilane synthase [Demequina sp. TTPB684]UPU88888.1 hydroxymethylbilane synthase [Demequina sp. TMPB413]
MDLKLGTRGSTLATAQSRTLADALTRVARDRGVELNIELHIVTTSGDQSTEPLVGLSQTGVFVAAVRQALLDGECDLIVHSLKDMPVAPQEGITLAALPLREDSRDALCSGGVALADLPQGAKVGTGSPRRAAQLLSLRPDLEVGPLRGNVDTRLGTVGDRNDAVVLAVAGLKRVGRADAISHVFSYEEMLPAPGQGALAIETLDSLNPQLADLISSLDHAKTRAAVTAERAALGVLDAGCAAPVGAHASVDGDTLSLHVRAIDVRGGLQLNEMARGPVAHAASIGRSAAHALLGRGAARLVAAT